MPPLRNFVFVQGNLVRYIWSTLHTIHVKYDCMKYMIGPKTFKFSFEIYDLSMRIIYTKYVRHNYLWGNNPNGSFV